MLIYKQAKSISFQIVILLILNISDFALALSLEQNFCEMKDGGPKMSVSLV